MSATIAKSATFGAASLLAAVLLAGTALADGLPSKGKAAAPADDAWGGRTCSTAANVGLTSEYVFRGISQSNEEAAVQGGVEFTCGRFYFGAWGSSIYAAEATAEVDLYAGFKHTTGPVTWDVGFIYYAYPGEPSWSASPMGPGFGDYVELKVGASGEVWKGGTLAGTVFYAADYNGWLGNAWTFEGTFTQVLPKVDRFTPTFSATIGHSDIDKYFGWDPSYTYWNVGLTVGFLEKWSVDFRYWGTDGDGLADTSLADDRFVASVKYTF
jgi:uncharacterized protein (TIGR02001 family)